MAPSQGFDYLIVILLYPTLRMVCV